MSDDHLYLTAEEAASRLGVNLPTLYAYVSRKNIRSVKVEGSRKRRYWAADIERLSKGEQRTNIAAQPALDLGNQSSAITLLTDNGVYYRGVSAVELADSASVEEAAELIWQSSGAFSNSLPVMPESTQALLELYRDMTVSEKAIALFPLVERENPRSFDLSPDAYARTGADVVRILASLIAGRGAPSTRPLHEFLTAELGVDPAYRDLIRRLMVLFIDHEFDHCTYSVRAAARTGVTPYYAAIAGLTTYQGRRTAYSRHQAANRLLSEICTAKDPTPALLQHFSQSGEIPGFNHSTHKVVDPRVGNLMAALVETFEADQEFKNLLKAAEVANELVRKPPEFVLLASFVGRKCNLVGEELALAGIARTIGWIAHASEQCQQPAARQRANYTGKLP
ncbi:citrate synthase [Pseudomonas sp. KSR10]|jgi:citrate synthase|uniref:citrate synthase (unknown stereospecificity) n=1 Tax=Stutzerimonas stutzeri TaxID=316 RepID=A0A0D9AMH3_STUST|nr:MULTISPECIES: citrate synthase [Pseudomonadaceae]KJH81884.1 DNA-binding protein [Stutzerimonas stutzeri]MCG6538547.1 citrate synthase [Pseudomonas sp. KSR10]